MSKLKDATFTDQEPDESIEPDPEYDTVPPVSSHLIYTKMAAIMADISSVGKDQTNQQQRFNYRGIDDVYNALHRLMAKHGVFTTSRIVGREREERQTRSGGALIYTMLRMRYRFFAADGSSIETEVEGEGMDSGDKSSNKAMAVAHKYALLQIFMIPTEEQKDPDAETHEVAPTQKRPNPAVVDTLMAAASLPSLNALWGKIPPEKRQIYTATFEKRNWELETEKAEKDSIS